MKYSITIPIFIVAKCDSKYALETNMRLLPYAYHFLKRQEVLKQVYVLSNSQQFLEYAKELGFMHTHFEDYNKHKTFKIFIYGILNYFKETKNPAEWYIVYNLRRPFKSKNIILDAISSINDNYDFVTSYSVRTDRSMFYIDEKKNFLVDVPYRNPSNCPKRTMIDCAIICCKKKFIEKCLEQDVPDEYFWKGKYKLIENTGFPYDIYEQKDLDKIIDISNICKEVNDIE